jgi:hypothetical protein
MNEGSGRVLSTRGDSDQLRGCVVAVVGENECVGEGEAAGCNGSHLERAVRLSHQMERNALELSHTLI